MANPITQIIISARDEASSVFGAIRRNAGVLATAITGYFSGKLFGDAVTAASDFESAMSRVRAAAGASGEELSALRNAAETAGATTQYSSVQAAEALENLAKAGLSANEAVQALPAVLNLASAGGVELGEASEYITKAVAGMGMSFAEAGRVADVLAMGANASNTSVTGLAQALSYSAPLANSLGLSLEQTVAIIGKFADAGIDASRAGTALNSILAQFSDPASKFRKALADAGITTTDFDQALRQLAASGPAGQQAILAVGQEAGPALRALLNQGIGSLDALKAKLDDSAGSARTFAQVMNDNLDGATKGLGSAWDALLIKFGTPLLEPIKEQVNALAGRLQAFVADGTATRFGESIAAAFRAGAQWVQNFIGQVDFTTAGARLQAFAVSTREVFDSIASKASAAGDVFKVAYGVMAGGTNVVITAWNSLTRILYNVQEAVFRVAAGFNRALAAITFGDTSAAFDRLAKEAEVWADRSAEAARIVAEKSGESLARVVENANLANEGMASLSGTIDEAKVASQQAQGGMNGLDASLQNVATSSVQAQTGVAKVAEVMADGAPEAKSLTAETAELGKSYADMGVSSQKLAAKLAEISEKTGITVKSTRDLQAAVADGFIQFDEATGAWQRGTINLTDLAQSAGNVEQAMRGFGNQVGASASAMPPLDKQAAATAEQLRALRLEYERFIAKGDLQAAAGVQQKIQDLKGIGKQAGETTEEVNAAFQRLGVTSSAALEQLANNARRDYETIRGSGKATAEDLRAAFAAYAEKAIAANNGVATEALKAEASMHKLVIETDSAGRAVVKSMGEAAGSLDRVRTSATGAASAAGQIAGGIDTVAPAAARAAKAMESVYLAIQKAGKAVSQNMALYGRWAQQLEEIAALNDKIGKQKQFLGGASGGIERDDSDAEWQKEIKDRFNKWDGELAKSRETGPAAGSTFYRQARNKGLAGDLTADEIARFNDLAAASYEKNRGNGNRPITSLDQWLTYLDGRNNRAIQDALNQIRDERKQEQSGGGGGTKKYEVTIRLPGRSGRTVSMASDEDAQTLTRILRELEDAAGVSQ